MNHVKFIEYKQTPGEKHLGIATVLINDIIFIRYKINPGKNGGYFPNPPSYKTIEYGTEIFIPAFVIESNMLKEQVDSCIKSNVNRIMQGGQQSASAFAQPTQQAQVHYPQANQQLSSGGSPGANGAQQMAFPAQSSYAGNNAQVQALLNKGIDGDEIPF